MSLTNSFCYRIAYLISSAYTQSCIMKGQSNQAMFGLKLILMNLGFALMTQKLRKSKEKQSAQQLISCIFEKGRLKQLLQRHPDSIQLIDQLLPHHQKLRVLFRKRVVLTNGLISKSIRSSKTSIARCSKWTNAPSVQIQLSKSRIMLYHA